MEFIINAWQWLIGYYEFHGAVFFWSQIGLTIISVTAHHMMQSLDFTQRKWGTVVGLVGQPFWFFFAYSTQAWFLLAVCFLYANAWIKGFRNHWIIGDNRGT